MQVVSLRCVDANNNLPGNAKLAIISKMKSRKIKAAESL